jgi:hypothetical protein
MYKITKPRQQVGFPTLFTPSPPNALDEVLEALVGAFRAIPISPGRSGRKQKARRSKSDRRARKWSIRGYFATSSSSSMRGTGGFVPVLSADGLSTGMRIA